MARRYAQRMTKSAAERYQALLKEEEPLLAEIKLNQWALEYQVEQTDPSDPVQMQRLSQFIAGHTEQIRKLEETKHKMEYDERLSWTPRQVQTFITQVALIIDAHVPTLQQKKSIAAAFEALLKNRKFAVYPDENTVIDVISNIYDPKMLIDG